ncbi:MAG: hypothetical protein ACI38B_02460 [Bifidobacterium sp.]|uniref:hypothetical protein n=1 Tax=Bifidobacterium sp. TaxID=41200 RepID=UPI003F048578
MKDVAADANEIAKTVAMPEKTDAAKTPETVDTVYIADAADAAETADIAFAHGPWLPLPVADMSDVLDISVAAPPACPGFNLSDECDSLARPSNSTSTDADTRLSVDRSL